MIRYSVPINSLKEVVNPLDGVIWKIAPIDPNEVRAAANAGGGIDDSWQDANARLPLHLHRTFHIRRLARLLSVLPNAHDEHPITLCVGSDTTWFYDGNHRAAAAIIRGDLLIELLIAHGDDVELEKLFPGIKRVNQPLLGAEPSNSSSAE
ncbi:hypothetical protein [Nitrospirillum amazonense]|uniref:hypothetical protein n=1 Tax=Nitrospirillum amazonense TaxID=28077 RepID=UPI0011A8F4E2|nr:hypothetical protein [Nitrospirillum amazonense]